MGRTCRWEPGNEAGRNEGENRRSKQERANTNVRTPRFCEQRRDSGAFPMCNENILSIQTHDAHENATAAPQRRSGENTPAVTMTHNKNDSTTLTGTPSNELPLHYTTIPTTFMPPSSLTLPTVAFAVLSTTIHVLHPLDTQPGIFRTGQGLGRSNASGRLLLTCARWDSSGLRGHCVILKYPTENDDVKSSNSL